MSQLLTIFRRTFMPELIDLNYYIVEFSSKGYETTSSKLNNIKVVTLFKLLKECVINYNLLEKTGISESLKDGRGI